MSEQTGNRELDALAAELRLLRPVSPAVDRDRLWYEAGCASVNRRPSAWLWPASTVAMTLVAASLAVVVGIRGLAPENGAVTSRDVGPDVPLVGQLEEQQPMALDTHWQIRREWNAHGRIGAPDVPDAPRSTEAAPMTNWHWRQILLSG